MLVAKDNSFRSTDAFPVQMFAELQMLTPLVPTREVYFVRYCKQLSPEQWAIVDVSIDNVEDSIDASLLKCRRWPSGCIIEDKSNGHCKVHKHYTPSFFFFFSPSQYQSISFLEGT